METPLTSQKSIAATQPGLLSRRRWLSGRQIRRLREAGLAYAFLIPSIVIIGLFGLFPLAFAVYESTLRGLNKVVGTPDGLGNYFKAIDNLAYVLGFWIAAAFAVFAVRGVWGVLQEKRAYDSRPWPWLVPGGLVAVSVAIFTRFVFLLLPELLLIPTKLRGAANTPENFAAAVKDAWLLSVVQQSFWASVLLLLAGAIAAIVVNRAATRRRALPRIYFGQFFSATLLSIGAVVLGWFTWDQVNLAYATALEAGEGLDIWSQVVTISAGFLLLLAAWWLWESADEQASNMGLVFRLGGAAMLMVGGWVLIGELPRVVASGDKNWWQGLRATVYYVIGTVPIQLGVSLVLSVLLFQKIRGQSFFRMVYFLPYIAPFVGTAAVFRILFSGKPNAPVNSLLALFGFNSLAWLNEPNGIFRILANVDQSVSMAISGPSLALVVIMIYGIWTFVGFDTVVFLAGLGSIPKELYEVAAIDGAGTWAQFRHVTLPLLSPTLYFLSLYAVIGTFKAFNHIYVLRQGAALGTADTASIVIFQAFKRDTRYGYASALAILLLIIILGVTAINNRIASRRVFYG
ncbi:MAG: sugar ABC transporter permease [Caldilineaceae bacterium]|nr:sugar ABC transporter permease [Caldilineaceae bacterium]